MGQQIYLGVWERQKTIPSLNIYVCSFALSPSQMENHLICERLWTPDSYQRTMVTLKVPWWPNLGGLWLLSINSYVLYYDKTIEFCFFSCIPSWFLQYFIKFFFSRKNQSLPSLFPTLFISLVNPTIVTHMTSGVQLIVDVPELSTLDWLSTGKGI